jgi:chemotaxis signal transduction protein
MSEWQRPAGGIPTPRQLAAILNPTSPKLTPLADLATLDPPLPKPPAWRPIRDRLASGEIVPSLLFMVGGERFAVPLVEVIEAIDAPVLHRLSELARGTMGVMAVRGALIGVHDPGPVLGCASATAGCALVVARGGLRLALAVDDVLDVLPLHPRDLRAAPGSELPDGILVGAVSTPTGYAAVIDLPALLAACVPVAPDSE